VNPSDPLKASTSVDRRIEARFAELARRIRTVIQDPGAPQRDVDRALSQLLPELQRLTEHLEAAGGPRFARVCEDCGRLDLRTRWPTMREAEHAVGADHASWRCRWCDASEFVVLEIRDAVSVTRQGPRSTVGTIEGE